MINVCLLLHREIFIFISNVIDWKMKIDIVNYVNWDYPIVNGSYLTTNKYGKWNWHEQPNCIVSSMAIQIYEPELILNFDKKKTSIIFNHLQ